jgi:hypothetical protein
MRKSTDRSDELTSRYINGLDIDENGTLHVTWCYRDYVDAPRGGKPQQAGPNGPENVSRLVNQLTQLIHSRITIYTTHTRHWMGIIPARDGSTPRGH